MIKPAIGSLEFPAAPRVESRVSEELDWPLELTAEAAAVDEQPRVKQGSVSSAVRVVGIMAFAQSLLFIALWLLLCASAGAAPDKTVDKTADKATEKTVAKAVDKNGDKKGQKPAEKKPEFVADLQISLYQPATTRDPFSPVGGYAVVGGQAAPTIVLHLEGILYSATERSAVVDGQILTLNKPTTLDLGNDVTVKAVAEIITRDRVVVAVGAEKIELLLNPQNLSKAPPGASK